MASDLSALIGLSPKERLRCWIVDRLLGSDPSAEVLAALRDGSELLKDAVAAIEKIVTDPVPDDPKD